MRRTPTTPSQCFSKLQRAPRAAPDRRPPVGMSFQIAPLRAPCHDPPRRNVLESCNAPSPHDAVAGHGLRMFCPLPQHPLPSQPACNGGDRCAQPIFIEIDEDTRDLEPGTLLIAEKPVMLWNVFPFHPHEADDPMSNRCHTRSERGHWSARQWWFRRCSG